MYNTYKYLSIYIRIINFHYTNSYNISYAKVIEETSKPQLIYPAIAMH